MAKVKLPGLIVEISGTMGDYYFRKGKKKGEAILAKRPGKSKKPSKAQRAHWDRFTEASDYATLALADPDSVLIMKPRLQNRTCCPAM